MPYTKVKKGSKWKVYKKGPDGEAMGEALGTHDDEAGAIAQIAAIESNEDSDDKEAHTKCGYDDGYVYVPWGITSFADFEAAQEMEEAGKEARKLTNAFSQIAGNILGSMDIGNKAQALTRLANEFTTKIGSAIRGKEQKGLTDLMKEEGIDPAGILNRDTLGLDASVNDLLAQTGKVIKELAGDTPPENSLFIWKEGGVYRWIAAYSNNYRDEDNPAEIISTESHKEFDEALEKGEWPMPELWLWHIPYRAGEANLHTFDPETGFTLAAGTFDEGKEWVAEGMIKAGWDGVSHGMPSQEIQRSDDKDKTIITRHRSREISPLPPWAAANKLSFNIISKENDMSIPAHKREEFIKAFGADKVDEIEKALEGRAKEAQEAGIEQKETAPPEASPPAIEVQAAPEQPTLNTQDLAQAIASAVMAAVGPIAEEVKALRVEVKELQKSDAEKVAEKAAATPAASLEALVMERLGSGLFSKDTEVDGRSSLAKSKPTPPANKQQGGLFFENWLQAGQ